MTEWFVDGCFQLPDLRDNPNATPNERAAFYSALAVAIKVRHGRCISAVRGSDLTHELKVQKIETFNDAIAWSDDQFGHMSGWPRRI